MDQQQEIQDQIIKDEIVRNRRDIEHPTYGPVILRRATPRDEAAIAQIRGKEYHKLIRDDSVLSTAQLRKMALDRGIWSKDKEEERDALTKRMGSIISLIEALGYISPDKLFEKYSEVIRKLADEIKDDEKAQEALNRLADLENTESAATDKKIITMAATSTNVDDLLDEVDLLKSQVVLIESLNETQEALLKIQREYAEIFMDSLENRVSRTETLAKIFYCVRGQDGKHLWKTFESLLDETAENVSILVDEIYFFESGMTAEKRALMAKYGFSQAVPGSQKQSDESPEHPMSNSAGESQTEMPALSTESLTPSS